MNEQELLWNNISNELKMAKINHHCNICGNFGTAILIKKLDFFEWAHDFSGDLDLRESLTCIVCGSNSRARMLIWLLGKHLSENGFLSKWKENKDLRILETPGLWPHPKHLREKFDYHNNILGSKLPNEKFVATYFADLEMFDYPSEYFDFILSSDALEHIRNDNAILNEMYRVLKRNGKLLLQVPYCNGWEHSQVKVRSEENKKDIFLGKPEYHAEKSLVYRIYGRDLLERLEEIGFSVENVCIEVLQFMISLQPIIICTKSSKI